MEETKAKCYDLISEIMQIQASIQQLKNELQAKMQRAEAEASLKIQDLQTQLNELEKTIK